jgi:hypothetical protein
MSIQSYITIALLITINSVNFNFVRVNAVLNFLGIFPEYNNFGV